MKITNSTLSYLLKKMATLDNSKFSNKRQNLITNNYLKDLIKEDLFEV